MDTLRLTCNSLIKLTNDFMLKPNNTMSDDSPFIPRPESFSGSTEENKDANTDSDPSSTQIHHPTSDALFPPRLQGPDENSIGSSVWSGMESNVSTSGRRFHTFTPNYRESMRRRLRYFFMNPIEKWRAKGRLPWKLGLQLFKIIILTFQLILFGSDSGKFQEQQVDSAISLRHIFLNGWDSVREIAAYPPATGPYAVYTKAEFYASIDNAIKQYANVTSSAIGSFGYDNKNGSFVPMELCKTHYKEGRVFAYNETLFFDNTPIPKCVTIDPGFEADDRQWNTFSIEAYLEEQNSSISFMRLIDVKLKFNLKTVFVKSLSKFDSPDCYLYSIIVHYDNNRHDGKIPITLLVDSDKLICNVNVEYVENDKLVYTFRQVLNIAVVLLCCASILLCGRSLYNAQILRRETVLFFKKQYNKILPIQDQFEFVDLWYVMMITNDILILTGSALKLRIEQRTVEGDQYNTCAILLGSGNLLVWMGVLRYLGFFRKYNILILTMKRAMPNVLRFILCALLVYSGFCFCGWVVLGPYHFKFRYLSTTSECLFAMMNGDDLFATFAITNTDNDLIWWFSRIYLYLFISLFIYVVISLFISVIMDSYETIKEYYETGFPLSDLQAFISECTDEVSSGAFRQTDNQSFFGWLFCRSCCKGEETFDRF